MHDEQVRSGEVTQTHSLQRGREPYLRATHYTYSPGETHRLCFVFSIVRVLLSPTLSRQTMEASMEVTELSMEDVWQPLPWKLHFDRYDLHPVCGMPPLTTALVVGWPRLRVRVWIGESGWGVCACIGGGTCAKYWGTEKTFQRSINRV